MTGRILIYGLNYAPEFVGVGKYTTELAEWLAGHGHQIRVICAPPYYPDWGVKKPYRAYGYQREQINDVEVWRCPLWVPKKPQGINRILHLLSFALSSLWPLLRSLFWKPDCLLLVLPSLACAPAAIVFRRISGCRSWVHVQDFELAAATGLGITRHHRLFQFLGWIEGWSYRAFDRVSSISGRMTQRMAQKGVAVDRITIMPNWVDCAAIHPDHPARTLRHRLGLNDDDVVALYAGTLNYKQGLEVVIEAARQLRDKPKLLFIICGTGPESVRLKQMARDLHNVLWLEPQPAEQLAELLNLADVQLLPQRAGAADLVLPSKLGGMLASGRPVIATAEQGTEIADIVTERGIVVPPADHAALATAILELMNDPQARKQLGQEARRYAEASLDKTAVLSKFQDELLRLIRSSAD